MKVTQIYIDEKLILAKNQISLIIWLNTILKWKKKKRFFFFNVYIWSNSQFLINLSVKLGNWANSSMHYFLS